MGLTTVRKKVVEQDRRLLRVSLSCCIETSQAHHVRAACALHSLRIVCAMRHVGIASSRSKTDGHCRQKENFYQRWHSQKITNHQTADTRQETTGAAAAVLVFETSPCCDTITSLITTTARNTHSSSKQSYPLYRQQQQETMMKSYLAFFFLILSLATTCYVANAARRSTTTAPATSAHTKKGETNIFAFSVGECAGKSMERIRVKIDGTDKGDDTHAMD